MTIDPVTVREFLTEWRKGLETSGANHSHEILDDLEETLFGPTLPTLAELIGQGKDLQQYQWMQADHADHGRIVITYPGSKYIYYMKTSGLSGGCSHSGADRITPLPDLPRLEWPAQEPQPEYRPNLGPITLSPPTREEEAEVRKQFEEPVPSALPCPEDVPDPHPGEAWLIEYRGKRYEALFWYSELYAHWTFGMGRKGTFTVESPEATPIARLMPEVKP